jgi:biopolymer transport protein ExbD
MRLERLLREAESAPMVPIMPLVDVLFLLIIFLVLGARFDQVETLRLPEAHGRPTDAAAALSLELRADGTLWLEGHPLPEPEVLPTLRARAPVRVLLLPDERAPVGPLLRWYDRIQHEAGLPVQVGVRPPPAATP